MRSLVAGTLLAAAVATGGANSPPPLAPLVGHSFGDHVATRSVVASAPMQTGTIGTLEEALNMLPHKWCGQTIEEDVRMASLMPPVHEDKEIFGYTCKEKDIMPILMGCLPCERFSDAEYAEAAATCLGRENVPSGVASLDWKGLITRYADSNHHTMLADASRYAKSPRSLQTHLEQDFSQWFMGVHSYTGISVDTHRATMDVLSAAKVLAKKMPGARSTAARWPAVRSAAIEWAAAMSSDLIFRGALINRSYFCRAVRSGNDMSNARTREAFVHNRLNSNKPDLVNMVSHKESLNNFSYLHRCAAALSTAMFEDSTTFNSYREFVLSIRRHKPQVTMENYHLGMSEAEHIYQYFMSAPDTLLPPAELMSKMEGNPYSAAYAIHYMGQNDRSSSSPEFPYKWSQQPLEIDLYLPDDLAEKAAELLKGDSYSQAFDEYVSREIRVGHAGVRGMALELRAGCSVTKSSLAEVRNFMALRSWFRTFNVALQVLQRDIIREVTSDGVAQFDPRPLAFQRVFERDMRVVLDIKCAFDTTVLSALVESINRQFGVIVDAVGSFYALPKLDVPQMSSIRPGFRVRPPRTLTFFFSPLEALQGLKDGRIHDGDNVLVTGSSLLNMLESQPQSKGIKRLWETLPFTASSKQCLGYEQNEEMLAVLREMRDKHNIKLGMWTLEAQLGKQALGIMNQIANDVELFPLGFALGGEHSVQLWPNSECRDMGGRQSLGAASHLMRNVKARTTRTYGLFDRD